MKKLKIISKIKNYEVKFQNKFFLKYNENIFYIIDKNVYNIYFKKLKFKNKIVLVTNENLKTYKNVGKLLKKLINLEIKKNSKLIAIGGGILQDTVAFAASILFRGIKWDFYPTTLLSQGDSCIGSKTSINFEGAKNQLGNFYPPDNVIINSNFLKSLTKKEILSGLGELCHYFLLSNKKNWNLYKYNLENYFKKKKIIYLKNLVFGSLKIKKLFIEKDEFDVKERLLLNYGHSFGHAIEKITNHKIPHGLAVAHGINIANFISFQISLMNKNEFKQIEKIICKLVNLDEIKNININNYINILKKDKKNKKNNFNFIISKGLGKMFIKEFKSRNKVNNLIKKYIEYVKNQKNCSYSSN